MANSSTILGEDHLFNAILIGGSKVSQLVLRAKGRVEYTWPMASHPDRRASHAHDMLEPAQYGLIGRTQQY